MLRLIQGFAGDLGPHIDIMPPGQFSSASNSQQSEVPNEIYAEKLSPRSLVEPKKILENNQSI